MEKTNTIINIQNEANIRANGKRNNGNCDPCIILETGETFTSQLDLAERLCVSHSAVSNVICGRQQTLKGYHIISMSRLTEGADMILSHLRAAFEENERRKADENDAEQWRAYKAEQERIRKEEEARIEAERKAKEEHDAQVAKAIAKIERRKKTVGHVDEMRAKATERLNEAMQEYEALTGYAYGAEDCAEVA